MAWSSKTHDLLRDRRCALHSTVSDPDGGDGEFSYLVGHRGDGRAPADRGRRAAQRPLGGPAGRAARRPAGGSRGGRLETEGGEWPRDEAAPIHVWAARGDAGARLIHRTTVEE